MVFKENWDPKESTKECVNISIYQATPTLEELYHQKVNHYVFNAIRWERQYIRVLDRNFNYNAYSNATSPKPS